MKALVLSSGGVDSSTCLALAVEKYGAGEVLSLAMYYGQKHDKELLASRKVAAYYGVAHKELNLASIFADSDCTLLAGRGEIPHGDYATQLEAAEGAAVSTYVPFRNGLFLASAASMALANGCGGIYYGAHADDAAGNAYPDTSTAFNEAMNVAIVEGSGHALHIEAPFIHSSKADVVAQGLALGVPYGLTWSCYEGGVHPCGQCATCIDRAAAFAANGVNDPALEGGCDDEQ